MASLADYWPSSDDELPHPNTVSRQKGSNVQGQCISSTSRVSTLKQRDLVPKSAVVTPVRKVRRLRSRVQDTNNPLFQPWSAEDDNGTQSRTQSTMRESFAKLSLDTDFSRESPQTTTRSSRITAIRRTYPTRGEADFLTPSRGNTLTPLATNKSESHDGPLSQVTDSGADHSVSWARSSLLDGNDSDIKSRQNMSSETHINSFGVTDNTVDGRSDYSYIGSHDEENASNEAESTMKAVIPSPDSTASISSRAQHSVMSTYHREAKRNNATGPLQPLSGNILSPHRQYIQQYNESTLSESQSIGKYLKSSGDEKQLLSKFEHMRLYSHEVSAGDAPGSRDAKSDFVTPPTSPQDSLSTPSRPKPVPQTPGNVAASSTKSIRAATRNGMKRNFKAIRQSLAEKFLLELDSKIANGQVTKLSESTGGVKIVWTKTLHTTAGRANWRREDVRTNKPDGVTFDEKYRHHASIELAEKVVGDESRLLNVLAHEFCHLATFMISGMTTNPHGKEFKSWASKCSAVFGCRGVQVTTKHSYEIDFKYKWGCVKCGMEYQRHSKSIDTQRHRCGSCKGSLEQIKPNQPGNITGDGGPADRSEYQLFVKHHMKSVKEANPGVPQQGILGIIAKNWAELKKAKVIDHTLGGASLGAQLDEADVVTKLVVDLTLDDS